MSAAVIARDQSLTPSMNCCGDAEISGQLPDSSGRSSPSHGARVEPLAPAWPSCIAILALLPACTKSTMRFHATVCPSVYRPGQCGVMRASAEVQVISANTSPAPPSARAPKCTRWWSPGRPSTALYCAIGDTTTRLCNVSPRSVNGVNIGGTLAGVPRPAPCASQCSKPPT